MPSRFKGEVLVDPEGYRWETVAGPGGYEERMLIGLTYEHQAIDHNWLRVYDPFVTEPALFRIFAALEDTPEAFLRFASEYGSLSAHADIASSTPSTTFSDWNSRRMMMAMYVAAADGDDPQLPPVSVIRMAVLSSRSQMEVEESHAGVCAFVNVARDLWSVMNLQLAESIVEQREFRNCEFCGKPMAVDIKRSDRAFCSDTCRVKTYYHRKKKAISLREAGKTLREIAKATGSDMDTIKGWLQTKGK